MFYTTKQINSNWKIKAYGHRNGRKINTLLGVSRLRGGLTITFYAA